MKIFVTGGTGFVGSYLVRNLARRGHKVTVVTRSPGKASSINGGVALVQGDPMKPGQWQQELKDHDVIVNLAGASIFTYWTEKARKAIMESRLFTTRNVVDALAENGKEKILISASAVGYYGSREDDLVLDESSPPGNEFVTEVSRLWEAEAARAADHGVRVVLARLGIVLGRNGGALGKMVPAFKRYLGGTLGSGRQWFPWIHEEDILHIILFLLEKDHIAGPVNFTAPNPVRHEDLVQTLSKVLNKPAVMPPVPGFAVKALLGEFGNVLLKGQRVIPGKLTDEGYQFQYPELRGALENILRQE